MVDEAGLYVLLEQARQVTAEKLTLQAVAVRRADLIAHPDAYRGRAVKVRATYAETESFRPQNRRRYPEVAFSTLAVGPDSLMPLAIVTVDDPGRLRRGINVLLVGYFLKLRAAEAREPDPNTGETKLIVPVLVGRAIVVEPQPLGGFSDVGFAAVALIAGVALLAVLWFGLRVRIGRQTRRCREFAIAGESSTASLDPNAPENRPIDLEALERGDVEASAHQDATSQHMASQDELFDASGHAGRLCAQCGSHNRADARYCDQCGRALGDG